MLTVMRDRYVKGHPHGERCYELPIGRALTRTYSTDAHFVQYTSDSHARLNRDSGVPATMHAIVFDVDCSHSHGTNEKTPNGWSAHIFCSLSRLFADHPDGYWYDTKGGGRIVYRLPCVQTIATPEDAVQWRQDYAVTLAYLERKYAIVADVACSDWTRLFRLPRATREGSKVPESRWTCGDLDSIGALSIEPTADDLALAKSRSKAFAVVNRLDYSPSGSSEGFLFRLMSNRGLIVRPWKNGAYIVECPRHELHSCGKVGDGSTVLYPPASGKRTGAIHCLHAGCSNLTLSDWLSEFSEQELKGAANEKS